MTDYPNATILIELVKYQPKHKLACFSIFESNTPHYFAPQEKNKFLSFLNRIDLSYFVLRSKVDGVVACGGYSLSENNTMAWLRWDMVRSSHHQQGLGRYLTLGRMALICSNEQVSTIHVGTSQHTYLFYEKMGFEIYQITENGIALSIDEYRLWLKLDESTREISKHQWRKLDKSLIP
jgi:hypothetical protein